MNILGIISSKDDLLHYDKLMNMENKEMVEKDNSPLISIIMPVYNAGKFLSHSIESCLKQTFADFELVCVDDCSSDNSYDILCDFSKRDSRVSVYKLSQNSGSSVARNFALQHSKGRFVCFLDADDMYKPEFLEKQLRFCQFNGPFVFSSYDRLASKSYTIWKVRHKQDIKGCLKGDDISCLTAFFDTSVLGKPLFDVSLEMNEDSMYWIELLKKCNFAYGNQESLAIYRIVRKSKSKNKIKSAKYMWLIYRKRCNINFFVSIYYLLSMTIYSIRKYSNVK
jgi:glycosyltransferase involved in cell wall biosynthesis